MENDVDDSLYAHKEVYVGLNTLISRCQTPGLVNQNLTVSDSILHG